MQSSPRRPALQRLAAATAAATLALTGAAVTASPAAAQTTPDLADITSLDDLLDIPGLEAGDPLLDAVTGTVEELRARLDEVLAQLPLLPNLLPLGGQDAIDAAVAFSQVTYDEADTAVLARDDLFADALTTGALQGIVDAPLLLTASGDLDRRTAQELVRLGVDRLVVIGGEDAIAPLVLQKLDIAGIDVVRAGGATRIETAADVAREIAPTATTAVLTRAYPSGADASQAYADLLAVSPWAAQNGWPVLLTQTEVLTASVRDAIAASALEEVVVIGGTGAISQAVVDQLVGMGLQVRRVAGDSRYGTAVAIAEERGFADAGDTDRLILAEGAGTRDDLWAPGFAAAAHAARHDAPVLLTNGTTIPAETMAFITDGMADNLTTGGPAAICATFVDPIACTAAGLLLTGNLTDALSILDLSLLDLAGIEDLLAQLGLGDLVQLLDALDGVVDGLIGDLGPDALTELVDALTGSTVDIPGVVEGLIGSAVDPTAPTGDLGDLVDGLLGGGGTDPVGDVTDPVGDVVDEVGGAVGGAVGGVVGGVGGLLAAPTATLDAVMGR